jgi:sorbitol/mannitol transport system substrate-binding protein
MWYDATSAAGSLEAADSPVKGKMGYVAAPVVKTPSSGWLYAWSWSIQQASQKKENAWKFISWASSKQYEELVGSQLGWSKVPAGKRASTYTNPDYLKEAGAFAEPTRQAIETADPLNPGVQPRPAIGIQFVDIPEFTDLATQVSLDVSSAIAGQTSVTAALNKGQDLANDVAERYQSRENKK